MYDCHIFSNNERKKGSPMSEKNKAIARRYVEEFWNGSRPDLLETLVTPDGVVHTGMVDHDVEGWKQGTEMLRSAFPDFHVTLEDEMADGDKVIHRWILSGTHEGEFSGVPATGKKVSWPTIAIFRLSGDKIAEMWTQGDSLSLMQQMGAIPAPGG
jgi:steroid delta-isomerase-like uncharacterized protein